MEGTTRRRFMVAVDPDGNETHALHSLVEFSDKDVLEIGAGDGRMTWRYADVARSVLALDPRASDIELATRAIPAHLRNNVRFLAADATTYHYPSGTFDVAVLSHSLC
jgi:ubiquinone/menaquinone biosynthesis C-methylase UbiE